MALPGRERRSDKNFCRVVKDMSIQPSAFSGNIFLVRLPVLLLPADAEATIYTGCQGSGLLRDQGQASIQPVNE